MLSISVKHPDAEKFIDKKMTPGKVEGANISVKITDEFMECLKNDEPFFQTFPVDVNIFEITETLYSEACEYNKLYKGLVQNGIQTYYKKIDPKKLWDKIVYNAWKSAEPGILFWSKSERESTANGLGDEWKIATVNPCKKILAPTLSN